MESHKGSATLKPLEYRPPHRVPDFPGAKQEHQESRSSEASDPPLDAGNMLGTFPK